MKLAIYSIMMTLTTLSIMAQEAHDYKTSLTERKDSMTSKKILVAYYSWGGNTREIATKIQKATGGDLFEIKTINPYPSDYQAVVAQAKREIKEAYKPVLKNKLENIENYDLIFIGSPNWWSTIAPPLTTFLLSYELSGKTIVPFITHGGGGMANCETDIKKLCPKSNFLPGRAFNGSSVKTAEAEVSKWVLETLKNYQMKKE